MQNFPAFSGASKELTEKPTGLGLRAFHTEEVMDVKPLAGFLEAHSENYFRIGSIPFEQLARLRQDYPISLHGVGLSLGTSGGVSDVHLQKLKTLVSHIDPVLVSEHISWSSANDTSLPDLLPLPMTAEALQTLCDNISHVQETLKRSILIENPSSYLAFKGAEMAEPAFITEVIKRTGCGLLLDINNIFVSAHNIGFDALAYLNAIPKGIVGEVHLAGYHVNKVGEDDIYVDAHNHPVHDGVWELYKAALARFGNLPTLIEWDSDLPALSVLVAEARKADEIRAGVKGAQNARVA